MLSLCCKSGNIKISRKRGLLCSCLCPLRSHQFSYKQRLTQRRALSVHKHPSSPGKELRRRVTGSPSPQHTELLTPGNILPALSTFRPTMGGGAGGELGYTLSKIYWQHLLQRNIPISRSIVACWNEGDDRECCTDIGIQYAGLSVFEILERPTDWWRLEITLRITSSTCTVSPLDNSTASWAV